MSKQLVLMDHDGGVDDYLATMLLMTMEHIQTLGIVVTPADCYIQPTVSATRKILDSESGKILRIYHASMGALDNDL